VRFCLYWIERDVRFFLLTETRCQYFGSEGVHGQISVQLPQNPKGEERCMKAATGVAGSLPAF